MSWDRGLSRARMRPLIFSRWKCGSHNDPFYLSSESNYFITFHSKEVFSFIAVSFSLSFWVLIIEVDLGCSCCHLGSPASDRPRDKRPRIFRGISHTSNVVILQTLELLEGWKSRPAKRERWCSVLEWEPDMALKRQTNWGVKGQRTAKPILANFLAEKPHRRSSCRLRAGARR